MGRPALLLAVLAGCIAAALAVAPLDLIEANKAQYTALAALIKKTGMEDSFKDGALPHTYFLPVDHAFGWFKEYLPTLERTKMADIIKAIEDADVAAARQFLQQHIVEKALPSVQQLLALETFDSAANVTLTASGDEGYVNIMEADGYSGTIAGPVVFPMGQSFVYVISDGLLADPGLIVGHGPIESSDDGEEDEFDVIFEDETAGGAAEEKPRRTAAPPPAPKEEHGEL